MKFIFYILMIPLAFFAGKLFYPTLFGNGDADTDAVETVVDIKVDSPMGMVTETIDYHNVELLDYPEKVTLAEAMILTDKNGLSPLKLEAGSPVKPLLLDEMILEVTSPLAAHLKGTISVLETDFAEKVALKRMDRRMAISQTAKPAVVPVESTPAKPVEVAVAPTPSDSGMESVPTEPTAELESAPEPAAAITLNAAQIVAAMKASLDSGEIQELDASKVTNWEAVEDESFDGEEFQVGIATYKEMTILGEKTLQAKALFKKGELDKWIHAKTGMEIR